MDHGLCEALAGVVASDHHPGKKAQPPEDKQKVCVRQVGRGGCGVQKHWEEVKSTAGGMVVKFVSLDGSICSLAGDRESLE